MGGASNRRLRLDDGVLVEDNHIAPCGSAEQSALIDIVAEIGGFQNCLANRAKAIGQR